MPTVTAYCDRAMLLDGGQITAIGDPVEVSNRYLEVNMRALAASMSDTRSDWAARFAQTLADPPVQIVDAWLSDGSRQRTEVLHEGEPIEVRAVVEVDREVQQPAFKFVIENNRGQVLSSEGPSDLGLEGGRAMAGQRFRLKASVENHLAAGRYSFACGLFQRLPDGSSEPASAATRLTFDVAGGEAEGMIVADHQVSLEREPHDEIVVGDRSA
jgi:ABC-type glutathione transport system ATPase component